MIECTTHYGQKKLLPKDNLTFRPSVYAIIVDKGKVLLLNTFHTGTYALPGGGIDIGETIEEALKREVREETGLEIEVVRFHRVEEQFFYYNPTDEAFHSFLFFYVCRPKTFELCADSQIEDESVEKPRWVKVAGLQVEDFHNHGQLILEVLHHDI